MIIAELSRIEQSPDSTIGILRIEKEVQCFILENVYLQNKPNVSSIPPGVYICKRIISPSKGETFEVTKVHGRTHILFHIGNTASDTEGCLIVGKEVGRAHRSRAVLNSRLAFQDFMDQLDGVDEFKLVITENF